MKQSITVVPILTPTSKRRYRTQKNLLEDYERGIPFIFNLYGHEKDGTPCSIKDKLGTVILKSGTIKIVYKEK